MQDPQTVFSFDVDTSRLIRALETPDDIGAITRVHYEMDRALKHVVECMIPVSRHLKHRYTAQRISALLALGLPEVRIDPAIRINTIRNDFAHREKEEFLPSDVSSLHVSLEKFYSRPFPATWRLDVLRKGEGTTRTLVYGEMTLKEKFCFLGSMALASVATIPNTYERCHMQPKKHRE